MKGLPSVSSPGRAWFQNQNKLGRVRREGGEKETNRGLYVCFLPADSQPGALAPEASRRHLASPGLELCSQYHVVHNLAYASLAPQGDWKCAGASSFAFVLS